MFIGCLMAATSSPNLVPLTQNPEEKKAGRRSSDPHPPHPAPSLTPSSAADCPLWPPPPLCPVSSRSHRSSTASLTAPSLGVTFQVPQAFPEDLLASAREAGGPPSLSLLSSNSTPPKSNSQLCLRLSSSSTPTHRGLNRSWAYPASPPPPLGTPLGHPLLAPHLYS